MGNSPYEFNAALPALVSERDLAARWSKSVRSIQRMRARGFTPAAMRVGNAIRYRIEDILDFEAQLMRTARTP